MIVRRLFDQTLVRESDLKLIKALDTHLDADHITGLGRLKRFTQVVCGP